MLAYDNNDRSNPNAHNCNEKRRVQDSVEKKCEELVNWLEFQP